MEKFTHEFSQHSLQDYLDCSLRFRLRHMDQFSWPAALTDDQLENELHQRKGVEFHRLVQQWITGIPEQVLLDGIRDPQVQLWWNAFQGALALFPNRLETVEGGFRQAEYTLFGRVGGQRLLAKMDCWMGQPDGHVWIFDWKTNRRPIPEKTLANRIQTRVYRFLAVSTASQRKPEQVEMIYWQTANPGQLIRLPYSQEQYRQDEGYLTRLVEEICRKEADEFIKTDDVRQCKFCNYRSLCERGILPGSVDELEQSGIELDDFSDVEMIEY